MLEWWTSTIRGVTAPTPPSGIYLALSTTLPTASGTGVTEPTDANYARVLVPSWRVREITATQVGVENLAQIAFPALTAQGTFFAGVGYTAATGGTFLGFGNFPSGGHTVAADQPLTINAFGFTMLIST